MHNYDELYELVGDLYNNRHTEIEEYDILSNALKIINDYKRDIAYTELTGNNYTYAANMLVLDAYNYLDNYIRENNINIHGELCCTNTGEYPVYGGERVYTIYIIFNKNAFNMHIKNGNDLNTKLKSIRKKLVFKILGDEERQFLTLSQLNRFMEMRKDNPRYIEGELGFIINALNSIKYRNNEE
jgi:hypothetical protein